MSAYDYEVDVRPLSEMLGGGYVATVPELPGCMSDGETPEEALTNAYDAATNWLETARLIGKPIPAPKPAELREYA
jgi:predicted RNase H-like HicB family nuclease